MSDPLSNREIEDVLSSIRRLVAQGDPAQPMPLQGGGAPGKLVLTPAFRVAPAPVAETTDTPAVGAPGATTNPEAADPMPAALPEPEVAATARLAPETPLSLEATIAELEAAISAYGGPFEPDGGDAPALSPLSTVAVANVDRADTPDNTEQAELQAETRNTGAGIGDVPARPVPDPMPVVEGATLSVEPATPAAATGNVQPFASARRPDLLRDAHAAEPVQASDADAPLLEDGDEGSLPLDEALLRELVTDILREELQGALGQRITRNVRKLVRAEIARALASRDLG